jgi:hypothetical protein
LIEAAVERIRTSYQQTYDIGHCEHTTPPIGFEELLLPINIRCPNSIISLFEIPSADTLLEFLRLDLICNPVEHLRSQLRYLKQRDRNLYAMIEKLRTEEPDRVILIWRGSMHRLWMPALFDSQTYEVSLQCANSGSIVSFHSDALVKLATGDVPDAELKRLDDLNTRHLIAVAKVLEDEAWYEKFPPGKELDKYAYRRVLRACQEERERVLTTLSRELT